MQEDDELPAVEQAVRANGPEIAGVGLALAAVVLGAPAAVGAVVPVIPKLVATIHGARQRRAARALAVAAQQVGGADVLEQAALASEPAMELTAQVIEAAARTTYDPKILALGRVLGAGLGDATQVDDMRLITAALNDMEAPHVQVLALLRQYADIADIGPAYQGPDRHIGEDRLAVWLPGHAGVIRPVLIALMNVGAASSGTKGISAGGDVLGQHWTITDFGRTCLTYVEAAGNEAPLA